MNLDWFEDFVDEVVGSWTNGEKIAEDLSNDIGEAGEEYINEQLTNLRYLHAKRSEGSKSPSDVYAIKDFGAFIHIAMVSVKATAHEESATSLSNDEESKAKAFPLFVKKALLASKKIDQKIKDRKIVFTMGYAGVVFKDKSNLKYPKKVDSKVMKAENHNTGKSFSIFRALQDKAESLYKKLSK